MARITKLARPKRSWSRTLERFNELKASQAIVSQLSVPLEQFQIPKKYEERQVLKQGIALERDDVRAQKSELRQLSQPDFYHRRRARLRQLITELHAEIWTLDQLYLDCDQRLATATTYYAELMNKLEQIWAVENEGKTPRAKSDQPKNTKAGKQALQIEAIVANLASKIGCSLADARKLLGL